MDINRAQNEAQMPERFRRIQDAFRNSPTLAGQEALAELCGLITGFRPRTTNCKVAPFEVFGVMSKAEQRVVKFAMCLVNASGTSYGVSSLSENNMPYQPETCRLATPEEAKAFIEQEVASWEDAALLTWINQKLGAAYYPLFFNELDRSIPTAATAAAK